MNLDQHLGAFFKAHYDKATMEPHVDALRAAVLADPKLGAAARARHAELEALDKKCQGRLERRCVISAQHLKGLRAVFAEGA